MNRVGVRYVYIGHAASSAPRLNARTSLNLDRGFSLPVLNFIFGVSYLHDRTEDHLQTVSSCRPNIQDSDMDPTPKAIDQDQWAFTGRVEDSL